MASRAIWSGAVTFGMVSVPVKLYATTEGKDAVSFSQVRRSDGSKIRLKRVAEADGEEVDYADIAKAYTYGTTRVIFDDADMASLPLTSTKNIEVEHFTRQSEIDLLLLGKSYYVLPDGDASSRAYNLLLEGMYASDMAAIAKVALRQREHVAMLWAAREGEVIVLTLLAWPEEVRPVPSFMAHDSAAKEVGLMLQLIGTLAAKFNPAEHVDNYRAAVEKVAEAKAAGVVAQQAAQGQAKAEAGMNFIQSLEATVTEAKAAKKGSKR